MSKNPAIKKILPWLRNKYILTLGIFILWMLLFDSSNWLDILSTYKRIRNLEREKEYFIQKIEADRNRLEELRTNNENLEKFAREQYLMKRSNEEIFVIMPE